MMNVQTIKERYWALLNRYRKWRRPASLSLSPHPWQEGIARNLPRGGGPIVMIDGGAHDGVVARTFVERFGITHVHAFEPNSDLHAKLNANLAGVPGTRNALALAERSGELVINVNASPMTSSILPRNDNSARYFDACTQLAERRTIGAVSLDDWCDVHGVEKVDVLKLDLQGYEAAALRGAQRLLRRGVACVYLEVNFVPFYEGSCLFAEVDTILRDCGYRLYNLYHLCTHLPAGHIGSGDALYVFDRAAAEQRRAA